jgi:chloramphenicol 3-O-phosphotransferase
MVPRTCDTNDARRRCGGRILALGQLVVMTGPIASGKSSVAQALGNELSRAGRTAAVVDMDDCFFGTVHAPAEQRGLMWQRAHDVHGALVAAWLRTGVDVVIAHGPFLTEDENAALFSALDDGLPHVRIHLHASYDLALERVSADEDRVASRDPDFLRSTYERYERHRRAMPPSDLDFDSTTMTVDEIASALAERLVADLG